MKKQFNKSRKKKVKKISLPMKYNPALAKFEPELPLKKRGEKKEKIKINWKWIFWIVIAIMILSLIEYLFYRALFGS